MAVVRIDLEVNDKGAAQVLSTTGGQLKNVGAEGVKAGVAIGAGFAIAQKAVEATLGVLQMMGSVISGAIQGFVALGGHLADMNAKTAISTQALQKLAYAGSLVGVSEEEITSAAVKMERALANGDAVFGKLGLSVQKLRAMKPDEAFAAIATQIMKIKDPAGQAAAAMEVFGKSGATLLPLMKSDIAAATAEAERLGIVLGDKDVAAADALGDEATKLAAAWEGVKNQFAASLLQNPAILAGLESMVKAMGELSQWLIRNRGAISALVDIMIGGAQSAVSGFKQLAEWVGQAASKLKYFVDLVPGLRDALKLVKDLNSFLGMKNIEGSGLTSSSRIVQPAGGLSFAGGKNPAIKAAADAQKAWQDAAEAARKADDKFTASVKDNAYQQMLGIQNLFDKRGKAQAKALDEELRAEMAYNDMMLQLAEQNEAIFKAAEERKKAMRLEGLAAVGDAMQALGGKVGFIGEMVSGFANVSLQMMSAKTNVEKFTVALQTAADIYNTGFQSKSTGKGALSGAAKGAAVGTGIMPGWGTVIGAGVGAIIGIFGAKKGQAAEIKALTADFNALMAQAKKAGITITQAFDTKSAKGLKKAIEDLNKTLADTSEAQEKLQAAIEKYGFTIDELGPTMSRQMLDEQMGQIYQDWQLLNAAGVDHEAIMKRVGPAVGGMVDQYVNAGVEIPKAMKPIIDDLYTHGKLIHENGEAYTQAEYEGISYAQTMSQMFEELIGKVTDLVNALLGIQPRDVVVRVRADDPDGLLHGGGGGGDDIQREREQGYASGLLVPSMSRDRTIRVHRGERVEVTPAANSAARNGSNGGGMTNVVNVTVQGDGDAQKIRDVVQRALDGRYIKVPA